MNSYCERLRPMISEYVDESLDSRRSAEIERHIAGCSDCMELVQSFRANKSLLSDLPLRQTSAGFEAELARRIAALNAPASRRSWMSSLGLVLRPARHPWRPAFAAVAVAGIVGASVMVGVRPAKQSQPAVDNALIAHIVAQHQGYVATQPLSDWSAQTLAGQLDASPQRADDADVTD
jgi:anti-sigma factor RsiW